MFSHAHVKTTFVLTSIVHFYIWIISNIQGILCLHVVRNIGQFTYSRCKVTSLSWFAHFGTRNLWRWPAIKLFPSNGKRKEKDKRKKNACAWYRHECEPVIQILNMADCVVVWGFMPLWEVGSSVLFQSLCFREVW